MAILNCNIDSLYLHGNTNVSIVMPNCPRGQLPQEYFAQKHAYKVLWLLHGAGGDASDWVRKTKIELYCEENDLVAIMPSGGNYMYTNRDDANMAVYDYFFQELIPMMRSWLPISAKKEDNFIMGLSMGGNGAMKYAFVHPEMFAGAACLSASPFPFENLDETELNRGGLLIKYKTKEAMLASDDNTWRLAEEMAGKSECPRLYLCVGSKDKHVQRCKNFWQHAREIGLQIYTEEFEGYAHEWRVWDIAAVHALNYFGFHVKQ